MLLDGEVFEMTEQEAEPARRGCETLARTVGELEAADSLGCCCPDMLSLPCAWAI